MASNTPNYDLKKPASTDFYNVEDQNANMDKLDAALKELADGKAAATHAAQHAAGGSDPVTPGSIGAAPAVHTHDDRYFTEGESLSPATAALFGLGSGAVPNNVLAMLGRFQSGLGNEYVWYKYQRNLEEVRSDITNIVYPNGEPWSGTTTFKYSTSVSIDASKKVSLVSPESVVLGRSSGDKTVLRGKYLQIGSDSTVYFMRSDGYLATTQETANQAFYWYLVKSCYVTADWVTTGTYLNAANPGAYPPTEPDGYEYLALGQLGNKVRITTGSYTGTGTGGSTSPNSLTFDFTPKIVVVVKSNDALSVASNGTMSGTLLVAVNGAYGFFSATSSSGPFIVFSWSALTLSWYTNGGTNQFNDSGVVYKYFAIG